MRISRHAHYSIGFITNCHSGTCACKVLCIDLKQLHHSSDLHKHTCNHAGMAVQESILMCVCWALQGTPKNHVKSSGTLCTQSIGCVERVSIQGR